MKKIINLLVMLLLFSVVATGQTKIGTVTLKDSSGVLVISAPLNLKTLNPWIKNQWMNPVKSGSGLLWDSVNGVSLKLGTGLTVSNDTLKYNGTTVVTADDTTLYYQGGRLKVRLNNGITKDLNGLSLKLDATNLQFDGSGYLQVKTNSITESQISKDLNLDSVKIAGMSFRENSNGILGFSDSLFAPRIVAYNYVVDGITPVDDATINFKVPSSSEIASLSVNDVGTFYIQVNPSTLIPMSANLPLFTDFYDSARVRGKITVLSQLGKESTFYSGIELRFTDISTYDSLAYNFDNVYGTFFRDLRLQNARLQGYQGTDVASANNLTLGKGNYFEVTGTTDITTISAADWQAGSIITLYMTDVLRLKHNVAGGGASLFMKSGADFQTSAGDIVSFVYDGTYWREISRTDN